MEEKSVKALEQDMGVPSGPSAEDERPTSLREIAVERLTYFRSRVEPTEDCTYGDGYRAGLAQLFAALDGHLRDADARLTALASRAPAGEPTPDRNEFLATDAEEALRHFRAAKRDGYPDEWAMEEAIKVVRKIEDYVAAGAAPDGRAPSEEAVAAYQSAALEELERQPHLQTEQARAAIARAGLIAAYAVDFGATP